MLDLLNLPSIDTINDFSNKTKISSGTLFKISSKPELFYKIVEIQKKYGNGTRILACPSYKLKAIQAWILRNILEKFPVHPNATAYNGKSLDKNLSPHIGNEYLLCLDLENFFPNTKRERVFSLFFNMGYSKQASVMFTNYCTFKGGLPQGGVTSPYLSNLINKPLDEEINKLCNISNITYTRYADDITLSSNSRRRLIETQNKIKDILNSFGYDINNRKTRFLHQGVQRRVTGLIYNNDGIVTIGRKNKRLIRAKIYNLETNLLKVDEAEKLRDHIDGWMAFLKSVDSRIYHELTDYWSQLKIKQAQKNVAADKEV
jgi:RNA-directed DNA polymerase